MRENFIVVLPINRSSAILIERYKHALAYLEDLLLDSMIIFLKTFGFQESITEYYPKDPDGDMDVSYAKDLTDVIKMMVKEYKHHLEHVINTVLLMQCVSVDILPSGIKYVFTE